MTAARPRTPASPAPSRAPRTAGGTADDSGAGPQARPGLRERKKIRTRRAIREATYRLVGEQGYEATTVEQIADAAEVSPSTVLRYFPAKEDIVLTDESDSVLADRLRARPADEPLIVSLRTVLRDAWTTGHGEPAEVVRLRARLMRDVPAVRSRVRESMSVTGRALCRVVADRTGRDAGDLEVRAFAMGLLGALLETTLYWAERGYDEDLAVLVDRALEVFGDGPVR